MAIKVPIVTEFNQAGLTDAEKALRSFGVKSTSELKKAAAGFAVLGGAGLAAFSKLDAGYDAIVTGTGATGDALKGLKDDANAVAREVPNSFEEVGTAIAEVNTRLGLTGEPLQDMTKRFLDLARVTGTDVQTAIGETTRTFKDWGVEADDQAAVIDKLYGATQQSGIGFDKLNTSIVQFGAPMRQLGFTMDEAIALFSEFELQGVNTEAVMSGLRQGLGRLAKDGEEPVEAFKRIVEEIEAAGDAGEANKLAIETFGQRAGPDMAAAIREGRFELDEMVGKLGETEGALETAAEETLSVNDRMSMLGNNLLVSAAPAVERFAEIAEVLVGVFASMPEPIQSATVALGAMTIALKSGRSALAAFGIEQKKSTAAAGKMNVATVAAGVALVGYGLNAKKAADEAKELAEAVDDLSRAQDAEIVRKYSEAVLKAYFTVDSLDEAVAKVAESTPGATARMLEMEDASGEVTRQLIEQGASTEEAVEVVDQLREAVKNETAAQEAAIETMAQADLATGDLTASTEVYNTAISKSSVLTQNREYWERQMGRAVSDTADEVEGLEDKYESLRESLDDRETYLNLQNTLEDVEKQGAEAFQAAADGADDAERQVRDYEIAQIDLKNRVIDYAEQVGNVPEEKLTDILADIDEGKLAEAKSALDTLALPRNVAFKPVKDGTVQWTSNSGHIIRYSHTGSRFAPGETKMVVPGQVFTPDVPGRLASVEDSKRMTSGSGDRSIGSLIRVENLTINDGTDLDGLAQAFALRLNGMV